MSVPAPVRHGIGNSCLGMTINTTPPHPNSSASHFYSFAIPIAIIPYQKHCILQVGLKCRDNPLERPVRPLVFSSRRSSPWVALEALPLPARSASPMDRPVRSTVLNLLTDFADEAVEGIKGLAREPYIFALACFASIGGVLFGYDQGVISGVLVMSDFVSYPSGVTWSGSLTHGSVPTCRRNNSHNLLPTRSFRDGWSPFSPSAPW